MFLDLPAPRFEPDDIRAHSPRGSYPAICIDDEHFLITEHDFKALPEYSATKPSGVFAGKCWKANRGGEWWIGCYINDGHPDGMLTPFRKALIVALDPPA